MDNCFIILCRKTHIKQRLYINVTWLHQRPETCGQIAKHGQYECVLPVFKHCFQCEQICHVVFCSAPHTHFIVISYSQRPSKGNQRTFFTPLTPKRGGSYCTERRTRSWPPYAAPETTPRDSNDTMPGWPKTPSSPNPPAQGNQSTRLSDNSCQEFWEKSYNLVNIAYRGPALNNTVSFCLSSLPFSFSLTEVWGSAQRAQEFRQTVAMGQNVCLNHHWSSVRTGQC